MRRKIYGPWVKGARHGLDLEWIKRDIDRLRSVFVWQLGDGSWHSSEVAFTGIDVAYTSCVAAVEALDTWMIKNGYILCSKEKFDRLRLLV